MKPDHQTSPASPKKPVPEARTCMYSFYTPSQTQTIYQNPESALLHSPQLLQAWTVFTSLEILSTQKVVMYYKINACSDAACQHGKLCLSYHSFAERRRPPFYNCRLLYIHTMCPYVVQGLTCNKGDQCAFAHNNEEIVYHPAKYKTAMCLQGPLCLHELCPWAHSTEELRNVTLTQSYTYEPVAASTYASYVTGYAISPEAAVPVQYAGTYQASVPALDAELSTFKTEPCTVQYQHNHKHCVYYHTAKDRRRVPGHYSAERCEASENDNCPLADNCPKSHSMVERLYHPDKYKTKYCNNYPDRLQECEYGSYCCFAHSDAELKVELIHYFEIDEDFFLYYFKTGWCPFNHEHNKAACVYAHNWQDFRRKPHLFQYSNELCPNWQSETFISEYKEGCIYEHNCGYCHGWKEQLYHPLTYKTIPCPDIKKCQKGMDCPYFHTEYDRRYPNKFIGYFPRPRKYRQNPNLTITNNVNIQKEYELRQMHPATLQTSIPISFFSSNSATALSRRYSEEVQYKSSVTSSPGNDAVPKHKSSYDLTSSADKRGIQKAQSPLIHIREESPESPKDDDKLFEIFEPLEDSKTASTLFFSPKISKGGDGKRNTLQSTAALSLQEGSKGYRSCPATPLPKKKSFVKSPVFEKLHLAEGDPLMKENTDKEMKKVCKFLSSVGLESLYPLFAGKGLTMNDILIMSHDQYKELGIKDESEIKEIMEKMQENLEKHFEEGLESPGKSVLS